jgi:hypothetical protein
MGKNVDLELGSVTGEGFISGDLVQAARTNPSLLSSVVGPKSFAAQSLRMSKAWGNVGEQVTSHVAAGPGVPAELATSIASNAAKGIAGMVSANSVSELKQALAHTGVQIAVDALAPLPIVGPVAGAIGGLVRLIIDLSNASVELAPELVPPQQDYSRDIDQDLVNGEVLPTLMGADWTDLFMPRWSAGYKWVARERETGWAFMPQAAASGAGFIPGTQQVTDIIQTYWINRSARASRGGLPYVFADVQDVGDFYPGMAMALTSASEQVQGLQTQAWAVDARKIEAVWEEYVWRAFNLARALYRGKPVDGIPSSLSAEHRQALARAFISQFIVSSLDGRRGGSFSHNWTPTSKVDTIFTKWIKPWCRRQYDLQFNALGTIAVAYADPTAPVFAPGSSLLERLLVYRTLLLDSPAAAKVELDDIVDPVYKEQLFQARLKLTGYFGKPPPAVGKVRRKFQKHIPRLDPEGDPPPSPQAPEGGAPFGPGPRRPGVSLLKVGAVAGAAYVGYKLWKAR